MKNDIDRLILLELASRIKVLRKEKKLSQAVCYIDTGINFGRIERGKRDISFTTLCKISKYFDISLKDFIGKYFDII